MKAARLRAPRVVIVEPYPHSWYGAQRLTHLLACSLPSRGWEVEVVTPGPGRLVDRLRADGVRTVVVRVPDELARFGRTWRGPAVVAALPAVWWGLARLLRGRADLVHVNDHRGLALAGPAARAAGLPLVWHVHSIERAAPLDALGDRLADRVLVCSQWAAAELRDRVRHAPVVVVPNAVPSAPVTEPPVDRADSTTLLTLGRLHPHKGVDVLLDALALVRRDHPDARLVVGGDATPGYEPYSDELTARCARADLAGAVELTGFVDDPEPLRRRAAVYVQPSRREPFGLAALEAMAAGMPVVASRVGGLVEVVAEGRTGLLVPPDDPCALASALTTLLDDPPLRERLGEAGADRARSEFAPDRLLDRVVEIYEAVLTARRRR